MADQNIAIKREKIAQMSGEVVDSNPYRFVHVSIRISLIFKLFSSRLMALKRMGIVKDYEV